MPKSRKSSRKSSRRRASAPVRRGASTTKSGSSGRYTYANPGPWGKAGRFIGSNAGALLGHYGGRFLGPARGLATIGASHLGDKIGGLAHYVGRIFGSGDYKIGMPPSVNSLFTGSSSRGTQFTFGEKSVRFRHKEYISDVISSGTIGAFQLDTYPLNPGIAQSFPFLAALAQNFQTYKMHGLVYEFKSMSANALNSTNTALGSVISCIDYNAATGPFVSKQDMLNSLGAIDAKPSECFLMGVECDPKKIPVNELYVRTSAVPTGQDARLYDLGVLNIASTGMQAANVNLGELHVIYDIELMLPILNNTGTTDATCMINFALGSITSSTLFPEYSSSLPQGSDVNSGVFTAFDSIGMEMGANGTTGYQIAFPPSAAGGVFRIQCLWQGASTASVTGPGIAPYALTVLSQVDSPVSAATTTTLRTTYYVQIPQKNTTNANWPNTPFTTGGTHPGLNWPYLRLIFATATLPGTLTYATVCVDRVNPKYLNITPAMPANRY